MSKTIHRVIAFREFVPHYVRIGLLVVFSIVYQFSATVYPALGAQLVGAHQWLKEDVTFLSQMTMLGVCFVFPLLIRFKLRFTSQEIIVTTSLVIILMMVISLNCRSMTILAGCSFILGAAKMLGTFESLISVQLIITPNKDYGVFFSVALGIVLACGQLSGIAASYLNDAYDWTALYKLIIMAIAGMVILVLLLFRNVRVARKLPLYGIDWLGLGTWCAFFASFIYFFSYGQVRDWFYNSSIRVSVLAGVMFALLTLSRMSYTRRPFISMRVFTIRHVNVAVALMLLLQLLLGASGSVLGPFTAGVLRLDDLNNAALNWWTIAGIVMGSIFSYLWFLRINGSFKVFFVMAFSALTLYHLLMYFAFSTYAEAGVMSIPYLLRGFGQMLIFAGTAKYITSNIPLDIFMQVLCYMGMARNVLGSLVPVSLIGYWQQVLATGYHQKLASGVDFASPGAMTFYNKLFAGSMQQGVSITDAGITANRGLYGRVYQQAVVLAGRDIFGFMTVGGIVLVVLILCIHFSRPFIRQIPSWRKVRAVYRGEGRKS